MCRTFLKIACEDCLKVSLMSRFSVTPLLLFAVIVATTATIDDDKVIECHRLVKFWRGKFYDGKVHTIGPYELTTKPPIMVNSIMLLSSEKDIVVLPANALSRYSLLLDNAAKVPTKMAQDPTHFSRLLADVNFDRYLRNVRSMFSMLMPKINVALHLVSKSDDYIYGSLAEIGYVHEGHFNTPNSSDFFAGVGLLLSTYWASAIWRELQAIHIYNPEQSGEPDVLLNSIYYHWSPSISQSSKLSKICWKWEDRNNVTKLVQLRAKCDRGGWRPITYPIVTGLTTYNETFLITRAQVYVIEGDPRSFLNSSVTNETFHLKDYALKQFVGCSTDIHKMTSTIGSSTSRQHRVVLGVAIGLIILIAIIIIGLFVFFCFLSRKEEKQKPEKDDEKEANKKKQPKVKTKPKLKDASGPGRPKGM